VVARKNLLYVTGKEGKMGRKRCKGLKILFVRCALTKPLQYLHVRVDLRILTK